MGESPAWIQAMLGHSTAAQLFRVYAKYVPTARQDGAAFTAGMVGSDTGVLRASAGHGARKGLFVR